MYTTKESISNEDLESENWMFILRNIAIGDQFILKETGENGSVVVIDAREEGDPRFAMNLNGRVVENLRMHDLMVEG